MAPPTHSMPTSPIRYPLPMKMLTSLAATALLALPACGGAKDAPQRSRSSQSRDVVAVTSGPAEWIAGLMLAEGKWDAVAEAGARPSAWRPGDAALDRLISARKILLVGEEFEPWTQRAGLPPSRVVSLVGMADPSRLLITEGITHTHGTGAAHSHGGIVPTVWTDPDLFLSLLPQVAKALGPGAVVPRDVPGLDAYRTALAELKTASRDRAIIASGHGLEYIGRAAGIELRVALLEPNENGPTNDRGAHQLEGFAKKPDDSGLLVWVEPPPAEFANLAEQELGLTSVHFDLGGDAGSKTLTVLTESTRRLTAALQP